MGVINLVVIDAIDWRIFATVILVKVFSLFAKIEEFCFAFHDLLKRHVCFGSNFAFAGNVYSCNTYADVNHGFIPGNGGGISCFYAFFECEKEPWQFFLSDCKHLFSLFIFKIFKGFLILIEVSVILIYYIELVLIHCI